MDFGPVGLYGRTERRPAGRRPGAIPYDTPVWWPSLFDALLSAVLTRKVYVRLLVSKWAHTSGLIAPFLVALQKAADAGRADRYMTAGQLEIKQFIIPGWDSTSGSVAQVSGPHPRQSHQVHRDRPAHQHRHVEHDLGLFRLHGGEQLSTPTIRRWSARFRPCSIATGRRATPGA